MTEYLPYTPVECNENNCTEYRVVNRFSDEQLLGLGGEGRELSPAAFDIIAKRGLAHMLPRGYSVGFDHHKN